MNKLSTVILSFFFGITLTVVSFYFFYGNCFDKRIDMHNTVSWYESQVCGNEYDKKMRGYPLSIYSYKEEYPLCVMPDNRSCKPHVYEKSVNYTNAITDVLFWTILSFGIIILINKLRKIKNEKR